jgi:multidrug efflux pump subunit AcrB
MTEYFATHPIFLLCAAIVAVVLYLFLANLRTTLISLAAIPASILITVLVFRYFELSINTMTLGGLAIAIGELVDDAVVGVDLDYETLGSGSMLMVSATGTAVRLR